MKKQKQEENGWTEFEQIVDASPAIIWISEGSGSCYYFSQQWYKLTGQTEEEARGFGWLEAIYPSDYDTVIENLKEAIESHEPFSFEFRLKTASGSYRWVTDMGNPRLDTKGNFLGYSGTIFDINDQKVILKELELKSDAIENSLNGFDIVSSEGKFIYANRAYLRMWRYDSLDEIIGTSPVGHCADPTVPGKIIQKLKKSGECTVEFKAKRKDNTLFDVLMWARLAYDADGNEIYPTTSIDISNRKKAEKRLRTSEQTLNLITSSIPDFIAYVDRLGIYRFANLAYQNKLGLEIDDVVGSRVQDVLGETAYEISMPNINKALSGQTAHFQTILRDKNNNSFHLDVKYVPDLDENMNVLGFVVIANDITELVKAKESAERANQLKSSFLANMSHEIRTPLGVILGFADLLKAPDLTNDERENYINIMMKSGEQLSIIINDILDLSKVEAGHLTLDYHNVDVRKLVEEVRSLLTMTAREKHLSLEVTVDDNVPELLVTDPVRLRQVLLNLVGNSIKFTTRGFVKLTVYTKPSMHNSKIYFEVQDTGIGVPENKTDRIFEVFVQADNSMTRRFGGTGLGLALSRKLARALGGNVTILHTEENKGTTMLFTIENRLGKARKEPMLFQKMQRPDVSLSKEVFKNIKILVVEDSLDIQMLLTQYLNSMGAQIDIVSNGLEAFDRALQNEYDIVLMDIQMPIMDGYTATAKLRAAGYTKPIIALTAHAMSEVRKQCLDVGCTDYVSKPINAAELKTVLDRNLQSSPDSNGAFDRPSS